MLVLQHDFEYNAFFSHKHDIQLLLVVDYFSPCVEIASLAQREISGIQREISGIPSVLLLTIVVAIVGVAVVVVAAGAVVESSSVVKLSFVVTRYLHWSFACWAYAFHQDKASLVKVPVANVTLFSSAHLLRENTDSVRSNQRIRPTAPSVPLK
ncbi:hypothetical protein Tco_0752339 [Tanacetum coccineum]|uniref:Uncharacterized protein n=1 Tax=Tanacetum coccineum TaxID=301880 RepID=A0ABQ4Z6J5_9ASTR